ncbi:MAG TPA: bacteriochlorophyll 4-vinyl reductase [Chloroflexia bacterium]|nr:bacteriochlorophyll 4-vinyl reductase [Chloroflexia bacterium]
MTTIGQEHAKESLAGPKPEALIGPNSLIQTVRSLQEVYGSAQTRSLLEQGNFGYLLQAMPSEMVDQQKFISLVKFLFDRLGEKEASTIMGLSGEYTADYILANRIPRPVQALLKVLPRRLSLRMLLSAVRKNAWTFAGSGIYSFVIRPRPVITLDGCITGLALRSDHPLCTYYAAAFEGLLEALVDPKATVRETDCLAAGAGHCVFEISF